MFDFIEFFESKHQVTISKYFFTFIGNFASESVRLVEPSRFLVLTPTDLNSSRLRDTYFSSYTNIEVGYKP